MKNKNGDTLRVLVLLLIGFTLFTCSDDDEGNDPQETIYELGDLGPAGGFVFYDKGETTDGWRYMEAAPSDLAGSEWGCFNTPVLDARGIEVGTGLQNTIAIVEFHDALNDFYNNPDNCSVNSNGTVAAKICYDLVIGNFDNWHLPSEDEAELLYENLHLQGLGGFEANVANPVLYWTSTEHDDNTATATDFSTGVQGWNCKQCDFGTITRIRAVRYF
jgi:hypothetical protein